MRSNLMLNIFQKGTFYKSTAFKQKCLYNPSHKYSLKKENLQATTKTCFTIFFKEKNIILNKSPRDYVDTIMLLFTPLSLRTSLFGHDVNVYICGFIGPLELQNLYGEFKFVTLSLRKLHLQSTFEAFS